MTGYCHSCGHNKPLDNQTKYCDNCYQSISEQTAANHKRGMFVFGLQEPISYQGHDAEFCGPELRKAALADERPELPAASSSAIADEWPESWQEADAHPEG